MILSITFSKPAKNISEILGKDFLRAKIRLTTSSDAQKNQEYFAEFFTQKQAFHKHFSASELDDFIKIHAGTTFKNVVERTETEEITLMASKKGKITRLVKKLPSEKTELKNIKFKGAASERKKNYILPENVPVPFLVRLGIMTAEGKVINAKYDKFRQINRFLEFVDDILDEVLSQKRAKNDENPVSVLDFGSGKSYLTFAVQYFLSEIKKIPCEIFGLDLKQDVIDYCSRLAAELNLKNLTFAVGNIADFDENKNPDIVITLHACDTATDYALNYAISHEAKAILSVPCCQHEINSQLSAKNAAGTDLEILTKYGLIKEKFSALLTDAIRGDLLEKCGYKVQMLEFIDDSTTPKNTLIRAVRANQVRSMKEEVRVFASGAKQAEAERILKKLGIKQTLFSII